MDITKLPTWTEKQVFSAGEEVRIAFHDHMPTILDKRKGEVVQVISFDRRQNRYTGGVDGTKIKDMPVYYIELDGNLYAVYQDQIEAITKQEYIAVWAKGSGGEYILHDCRVHGNCLYYKGYTILGDDDRHHDYPEEQKVPLEFLLFYEKIL